MVLLILSLRRFVILFCRAYAATAAENSNIKITDKETANLK
jgi:hypothetical protein